jgi:hypothetical protein
MLSCGFIEDRFRFFSSPGFWDKSLSKNPSGSSPPQGSEIRACRRTLQVLLLLKVLR